MFINNRNNNDTDTSKYTKCVHNRICRCIYKHEKCKVNLENAVFKDLLKKMESLNSIIKKGSGLNGE